MSPLSGSWFTPGDHCCRCLQSGGGKSDIGNVQYTFRDVKLLARDQSEGQQQQQQQKQEQQ